MIPIVRVSINCSCEPFINYNLDKGWYLITDMILTANWQADSSNRWTIPLGGGVGKMFAIGSQKMNTKIEAYYNVEKPDGAPDWSLSWTLQFLFPDKIALIFYTQRLRRLMNANQQKL